MNKSWKLINGEERHAENPEDFRMAPRAKREGLKAGTLVKIGVEDRPGAPKPDGERFWVEIAGPGKTLPYMGVICNDLVLTIRHGLKDEDSIEFGPENVLWLECPPEHARPRGLLTRAEMEHIIGPQGAEN